MRAFLSAVLLVSAGPVLTVHGESAESVHSFEFAAVRATLATDDLALVLAFSVDPTWEAPAADFAEIRGQGQSEFDRRLVEKVTPRFVTRYTGHIWGSELENYCGQWLEPAEIKPEVWPPEDYHAATRVIGRTGLFSWNGWCNSAIEIRRRGDDSDFGHQIALKLLDSLYLLSAAPDEGFDRIVRDSREGSVELSRYESDDGAFVTERVFRPEENRVGTAVRLLTQYSDKDAPSPSRWMLLYQSAVASETYLWDVRLRDSQPRAVTVDRKGILTAHQDVERIERVGIRDFTGLGAWNHKPVEYLAYGAPKSGSSDVAIPLASIATFLAFALLFRRWHLLHLEKEALNEQV